MVQHGVLKRVLYLALSKLNSPEARSQALRTLGDLIRGHGDGRLVLSTATVTGM